MLLLAIISTLVATALGSQSDLQSNIDVKALCGHKEVDLRSSTQLHLIARQIGQAGVLGVCPADVSTMILELSRFLRETQENVCSKEAAQKFKDYYLKHIDKTSADAKNLPRKMPKRFKKFVLAVGMQMSNRCKRHMLDVLVQEDNNLLNQEDVARLSPWVNERGPLGQMLASMNKPGEIVLPGDLAVLMSRDESQRVEKMFIQSKATRSIKNLQETCRKRFQPIYEPLILPITMLSSIGFDHRDQELKAEFKKEETKRIIGLWSNIVFVCESLKFVEAVEYLDPVQVDIQDKTGEELIGGTEAKDLVAPSETSGTGLNLDDYKKVGKNQLRLLTKDEAEAINNEIKLNPKLGHLLSREGLYELDEVKFNGNSDVALEGLILDKSDGKLMKSINSFKDNKTQMDRMKSQMISRALVTLRSLLKKRKVIVLATSAAKVSWRRLTTKRDKQSSEDINKTLVGIVEKMADQTMEADSRWKDNEVLAFVVVLICGLAAFVLTTWAVVMMVMAAITAASSIFAGR